MCSSETLFQEMETCASNMNDECLVTDLVQELSSALEIPFLLGENIRAVRTENSLGALDNSFCEQSKKDVWGPYFSFANDCENSFSIKEEINNDLQSFLEKSEIIRTHSTGGFSGSGSGSGSGSECSASEFWTTKVELDTPPITPPDERISPENVFLLPSEELKFMPICTEESTQVKTKFSDSKSINKRVRIQPKPVSTTLNIFDSQNLDVQPVLCSVFSDVNANNLKNQDNTLESKLFLKSNYGKKSLLTKNDLELLQAKRKQERMIRNRESAYLSRKRKKEHVAHLEKQVQDLQAENKQLKLQNCSLRQRLAKYEELEPLSGKKPGNMLTDSPRKTTALLALLFTVCLNIGSFGSLINEKRVYKNVNDVVSESIVSNYPNELRHTRSLLWADNNDLGSLNSTYANLTKTSCPLSVNQTESIRLESELRRWIGGDEDYSSQAKYNISKISQYFYLGDRPRPTQHKKNMSKRKRGTLKSSYQKKNLEMNMYQMKLLSFNTFFEAIHRRDDTFYLVSFSSDHLLLPALSHNQSSRPKMSLMLPAFFSNVTGPDQVEMMQIDCEVTNTQLLSVNENDIPSHMRPYSNSTTRPKSKTKAKAKKLEEYFVSDLPPRLAPGGKTNLKTEKTDLNYANSSMNQTNFLLGSFRNLSSDFEVLNFQHQQLNMSLSRSNNHKKTSQYLEYNKTHDAFFNQTYKQDQNADEYISNSGKNLLKLLMYTNLGILKYPKLLHSTAIECWVILPEFNREGCGAPEWIGLLCRNVLLYRAKVLIELEEMFDILLRRQFSPIFNRNFPVLLKICHSDSAVARTLPKLKAVTERDFFRSDLNEFKGNFIENLFINKFQDNVLEYPEIDTLEEVDDLKKHFSLAQRLITSLSEKKEIVPFDTESKNAVVALKNYELIGFKLPRLQKGFGYLQSEYTFLQEALGLNPSLSKTVSEFEDFGIHLINLYGSEVQKEQYLKKLVSGEMTACFAHIESGNLGSFETDSIKTTALLSSSSSSDTQSYVISGTKNWVYNAQTADLFIVLANVISNGGEKELKPTLFLVDKEAVGIEIQEPINTIGLKSLKISNVSFNNTILPESSVLGKISEGDAIIKKVLSQGILSNGGHCLPIMRQFINKAIQHCIHNEFFRRDKYENNYFKIKIGKMISQMYIVESMTYLLTGRLDSHKNADVFLESLIVKIFASESLQFIVQQCTEILGSEFFANDNLFELSKDSQFYAACDDSNIYLRLILSAAGLKHAIRCKQERNFLEIIQEMFTKQNFLNLIKDEDQLAYKNVLAGYLHPMFSDASFLLEDCVFILSTCTQHLLKTYGENVFERYTELNYLADIVINIYALLATLGRASRAYCVGVKFQEVDRNIAEGESRITAFRVRKIKDIIFRLKDEHINYREIGSRFIGYNKQMLVHNRDILLTAKQQHLQFQDYLKKQKGEVTRNLKKKILPSTNVEDYNFLEILGHGSYGVVVAAENITDKKVFALKIIKKKRLVKAEHLQHLMSEIRILNSIKFEFLISLEYYFTSKCSIFLVLPFVKGGNMYKLLRRVNRLEEHEARFFAAQIVLAIEYLHYMGIVYRDLKPENVLLDYQGYLKLVDFGFSKHLGHNYSYTFCGTPEYIAPEILLSKGYSMSPDWWTLGILLYEMCNGSPPFVSRNELKLYEKILSGKIEWPSHFSKDLKSIIHGLLQVDKSRRLGCTKAKVEDIKFHSWFFNFDWMGLWNKTLLPPITCAKNERNEAEGIRMNSSVLKCNTMVPSDAIGNIDFAI